MTSSAPQLSQSDLELLSAYIDRRLPAGERAAFEQRLAVEPALRRELEELLATVATLRDLAPVRPPRSFTIDAAKAQELRRPPGWRMWIPLLQAGGAFGTVIVLLLAWVAFGSGSSRMAGSPAQEQVASAPTTTRVASLARESANDAPAAAAAAPTSVPAATSAPPPPAAAAAAPTSAAASAAGESSGVQPAPTATDQTMAAQAPMAPDATTGGPTGTTQDAVAATSALPTAAGGAAVTIATPAVSSPQTTELHPPPAEPEARSPQIGMPALLAIGALVIVAGLTIGVVMARRRR